MTMAPSTSKLPFSKTFPEPREAEVELVGMSPCLNLGRMQVYEEELLGGAQ
jgi:hypothetical protein